MEKINLDKIRKKIKEHPPTDVAKETGFTYPHVYKFLNNISDNPTTLFVNAMIDYINKREKK